MSEQQSKPPQAVFTPIAANEDADVQAKDNGYIPARYGGTSKNLLERNPDGTVKMTVPKENSRKKPKPIGVKGECYFNPNDDRWYFRQIIKEATKNTAAVKGDWVRIRDENIIFTS